MTLYIRSIRQQRGMSLEQLAARIGMKKSNLAYKETGVYSIRLDELQRIAQALNVGIEDLYQEEHMEVVHAS